jgi:hypothetical protein
MPGECVVSVCTGKSKLLKQSGVVVGRRGHRAEAAVLMREEVEALKRWC